jgi:protein-tyrosine-phosphatase
MAVIAVDSAQVRNKFTRDYEKAMRDMEAVRAQLRQFEEKDKPQFLRWMHREFGACLTEMREVSSKLRTQEELLFRIQNISLFEGLSPKKAYDYVMHEQEEAERHLREAEEERRTGNRQDHTKREKEAHSFGGEDDSFFGSFPREEEDFSPSHSKRLGKVEQERLSRLKDIYRMVVRKLHPDTQQSMTQHKLDLWHQAQMAYEQEDADQLEVILAMCEIEDHSSLRHSRLSVLQRITAAFKRSLKPLKAELKKSQKDPAWNFSEKQTLEVKELSRRMRMDLEREMMILREELAGIESELAQIKSSRGRKSRIVIDPLDIFFKGF